ncbi:MAG: hypothetical protein ABIJ34_07215 [archaeon]
MENALEHSGIVLDNHIYYLNQNSNDAVLEVMTTDSPIRRGTYGLAYQGTMRDVLGLEETVRSQDIKQFLEESLSSVYETFLSKGSLGGNGIPYFLCLTDIIPALDQSDPRINDYSRSELLEIRRKEIFSLVSETPIEKSNEITNQQIMRAVRKSFGLDKDTVKFDFEQHFLLCGHENTYRLSDRTHIGDISISFNGGSRLLKLENQIDLDREMRLVSASRTQEIFGQFVRQMDKKRIDEFAGYCRASGMMALKQEPEIDYMGSGVRYVGGEGLFVYLKPLPFAMHDIRAGHTHKWYPFYNPPEIGVLIHQESEGMKVSEVHVNGDFEYFNFTSKKGDYRTFCGPGKYDRLPGESWQQSVIRTIMYGVNTLQNGLTNASIRQHSNGESYKRPMSQMSWITYAEVMEKNLLPTNMYPIMEAA